LDLTYDQQKAHAQLGLTQTRPLGRLTDVDDPRGFNEIESLKKQVARLTQLNRDRDSYIQELLGEAELAERRREGDLARRASRSQREVTERLSAQQREYDHTLEDRSKQYAASLAQQISKHEQEKEDLRSAMQVDSEQRLATRLKEIGAAHRAALEELKRDASDLTDLLASHSKTSTDARTKHLSSSGASLSTEPEPEHSSTSGIAGCCAGGTKEHAPLDPLESMEAAVAEEKASKHALESLTAVLCEARQELERLFARSRRGDQDCETSIGYPLNDTCVSPRSSGEVDAKLNRGTPAQPAQLQELEAAAGEAAAAHSQAGAEECAREKELRRQLRRRSLATIDAEMARTQHVVFRAWVAVASARRRDEEYHIQLGHQRREQAILNISVDVSRWNHVTFRAWRAGVVIARRDAAAQHTAEEAEAAMAAELVGVQEENHHHSAELTFRLRAQVVRLARANMQKATSRAFFWWNAAVREKQQESAHRYQLISAAADASAEGYRLKTESRKEATDLRRQRRAHGVAAIHASLDRRLQAVVHSWSMVARESQRETMYQRQLDIAAAESAASCAVLRMEWRRCALELREQRRTLGLRVVTASMRHWYHSVLYAWAVVVAEEQQEKEAMIRHGVSTAETAAARAEVRRQVAEVCKWQRAHSGAVRCVQSTYWMTATFSAWARQTTATWRAKRDDESSRALREIAFRGAHGALKLKDYDNSAHVLVFSSWRLVAHAQRERAYRKKLQKEREDHGKEDAVAKQQVETLRAELQTAEKCAEARRTELVDAEKRHQETLADHHEEARRAADRLEELEAKHQVSLLERAAELEARHAAMVRQHADATRALLAETEARHAEVLKAEAAQNARLRRDHAAELRAQSEENTAQLRKAEAQHAAALQAQELQAEAALRAQASASEVRLSEAEAKHAAALRAATVAEANAR
jgi:hypothetical protein